ncbi:Hypp4703 [Branchiostoma lanceolatum]|uniref:Hypp4703 protein n=1 Tax=Branchiostoma lanceolatum TaxID=7740 RepID=A0A8K0ABJ6_BRALA|nr:Hypp4703 [Branchiostoma lanceolatum]
MGPSSEVDSDHEKFAKDLRELDVLRVTARGLRPIVSTIARGHNGKFKVEELQTILLAYQQHECAKIATGSSLTDQPAGSSSTDLPTGSSTTDLPTGSSITDLPTGSSSTDLPTGSSTTDLPTGSSTTDLPTGSSTTDLPTGSSSTDLPTGSSTIDLPTGSSTTDLPTDSSTTDLPTDSTAMGDVLNQNQKDALRILAQTKDWQAFLKCCQELAPTLRVPEAVYATYETPVTKATRYANMPANHVAIEVTGNGDCLFNAVSALLTGSEDQAQALRLGSAVYGALHAEHIIAQYIADGIDNVGAAQMLLHSVSTPNTVAACTGTTVQEILRHTIQAEVWATARLGTFSGLLQLSFLAGFCGHVITLHCEDTSMIGYHNRPMAPCGCEEPQLKGELHIMLVKTSTGGAQDISTSHSNPCCLVFMWLNYAQPSSAWVAGRRKVRTSG